MLSENNWSSRLQLQFFHPKLLVEAYEMSNSLNLPFLELFNLVSFLPEQIIYIMYDYNILLLSMNIFNLFEPLGGFEHAPLGTTPVN